MTTRRELEHLRQRIEAKSKRLRLPSFEELLWLCDMAEALDSIRQSTGKPTGLEAAAKKVHGPKEQHHIYRKIGELAEKLNRGEIFFKVPGEGSEVTKSDRALVVAIKEMLHRIELVLFPAAEFPLRVRFESLHVLNTRLVPDVLDGVRQDLAKAEDLKAERDQVGEGQDLVEFDIGYDRGEELRQRLNWSTDCDLILTFCPRDYQFPRGARVEGTDLRRGLLLPNHDKLTEEIETDGFAWAKLAGRKVLRVSDTLAMPDFPEDEFNKVPFASVLTVDTHPQAHALVAACGGLTFTYPDLLREHEEQLTDAVVVEALGTSRLCLALCPHAVARRTERQRKVLHKVFDSIVQQLQKIAKGPENPAAIAAQIRAYRCASHTTEHEDGHCYWSRRGGTVSLRSTPSGYIKGLHTPGQPFPLYDVFGRIVEKPAGDGQQYHLLWRGSHEEDDHYAASFIFNAAQLKEGKALAGPWVGQASLLATRQQFLKPAMGLLVISQQPMTLDKVGRLIDEQAKYLLAWQRPAGWLPADEGR